MRQGNIDLINAMLTLKKIPKYHAIFKDLFYDDQESIKILKEIITYFKRNRKLPSPEYLVNKTKIEFGYKENFTSFEELRKLILDDIFDDHLISFVKDSIALKEKFSSRKTKSKVVIKELRRKINYLDEFQKKLNIDLKGDEETCINRSFFNPEIEDKLPLGFDFIDSYYPLRRGQVAHLLGRPGKGKSWMMCRMIYYLITSGKNVLFMSLEMKKVDVMRRVTSIYMEKNIRDFHRFSDEEKSKVEKFWKSTGKLVNIMDGNAVTDCQSIELGMCGKNYDIVLIDYMSKLETNSEYRNDFHRHALLVKEIRQLSERTGAGIVVAVQANRDSMGDKDICPQPHRIKNSGTIEEDSDLIISIGSDSRLRQHNILKVETPKARYKDEQSNNEAYLKINFRRTSYREIPKEDISKELNSGQ